MKMIVMFRRRQDLTSEQFRDHYETRHAPLAQRLFPYLQDYRRNYIRRDQQHRRAGREPIRTPLDFDAITEIRFASDSDYERMMSDMAQSHIREQVVADEERFIDRSATVVFLVDEAGASG